LSTHLRLLTFLRPYKKQVLAAWLVVVLAAGFTMTIPQLLRWSIDTGLKPPTFVNTGARLSEAATASDTQIVVDEAEKLEGYDNLKIGDEKLGVTARDGDTLTVTRGVDDTKIKAHGAKDAVLRSDRLNFEGKKSDLILAAVLLVAAAATRAVCTYWQTFLGEWLGQHVAFDLRNRIYDRLQRLSYAYHDHQQTGQIMSRATQDVEGTRTFIQMGCMRLLDITVRVTVAATLMFITNWQLALVAWLLMPVVAWRSVSVQIRSRRVWLKIQEQLGRTTTVLQENLSGTRVVKAFSREPYEIEKFNKEANELFVHSFAQNRIQASNNPFYQALGMFSQGIVLIAGSLMITRGSLTAGELAAFLLYQQLLFVPMRQIGVIVQQFARAGAAGERIFEVLDAESAVKEKPGAIELKDVTGEVRYESVSFGYDAISAVLKDVSFVADPGKVVALLGPTGSGKTTVVNLLPRFYDVTGGAITIDGTDIRDLSLASLRTNIGIIQQDVFLFSATVRDNIAYGAVAASEEEVVEAAKLARIHDFIMSLPDGYETWVGERGVTLSGGQKQRISIARTLLLNPRILILDDSTSSVDTQTEYLIQQALADVMKGRTTLVIAQRLRTVRNADQILVMKDGEIVERGKHEELIEREGLYRQIYDLELRDQEEALKRASILSDEVGG
jgi:ATP-binding cassette subfamily B protein